ncbi:MAG: methyltransferase domain-containing protein [Nanobdellota archaeon]
MKPSDTRKSIIERRGYREDIVGDRFSLYISNYPVAVKYLRQRIGNSKKVLAELCCGIGVSLEYMGDAFKHIIGVDIDEKILDQCRDNLRSVGLLQRSTLILGDITDDEVLKEIKADIVVYDIPFWSPHEYENQGDLTKKNPALKSTIERIREIITGDIIIFCSPKFNHELIKRELGSCEFQKVFINGNYDRDHIYLGKLKQKDGITELELPA